MAIRVLLPQPILPAGYEYLREHGYEVVDGRGFTEEDIIADIRVGMEKGNPDAKYIEIPDRLDALHYAVDHAQEGDLIAVIGKGHETYRDREGVKTPFLERELLEEYAQQIGLE